MYRRILVAYDGSPESRLAVDECVHLTPQAERHIHLACVLHDPSPYLLAGEFVPAPESLKAVMWEQNQDTPVGELLTPEQIAALKRVV